MRAPLASTRRIALIAALAVLAASGAAPASALTYGSQGRSRATADTSAYPTAVNQDSPAVYYRLDETTGSTAKDLSGNHRDGTYGSNAALGDDGALPSDSADTAVRFSPGWGVTQSGDGLPGGAAPRTVEFWARAEPGVGGDRLPTFLYGGVSGGGTNDQFRVQLGSDGKLWLTVDSTASYTAGQYTLALPTSWTDANWHLYDVTYDGGTDITGYMDGQQVGSIALPAPLATDTSAGSTGLRLGSVVSAFGNIPEDVDADEFAVYPTALTTAQINAHWTAGESTTGPCATASSPYAQTVTGDSPALYLRLGELTEGSATRLAFDSSGHCDRAAPTNAAFAGSAHSSDYGALPGDPDAGLRLSPGWGVTQSGDGLPGGAAPRTVEFWARAEPGVGGDRLPTFLYGGVSGGGTNDQFRVQLGSDGKLWLTVDSTASYTAGQYTLALPTSWTDANWHLYDVTYDGGTDITGYMDGQQVGSIALPAPLATDTSAGSTGLRLGSVVSAFGNIPEDVDADEFAVYPTALTTAQINAHWTARLSTPSGTSALAGSLSVGSGGPAVGAAAQACPTSGAACFTSAHPTDIFGDFRMYVPAGTYTVTGYPPPTYASGPITVATVVTPPSVYDLAGTFAAPAGMPSGTTFTTPSGTQDSGPPRINWGQPTTVTATGCSDGFGALTVQAVNTSTGEPQTRAYPLVESPAGSGTYTATVTPVVPLHGQAKISQAIGCPGHSSVLPDGGSGDGGTQVALAGSHFIDATHVTFAGKPAESFKVLQDDVIEAVAPAGSGTVTVTVTKADGKHDEVGSYSYVGVTSLHTTSGPSDGGTPVAIHGYGFTNVTGVVFGDMMASSVNVVSPTEVDAVTPPGVGTVDVQVVNGLASSVTTTSDYFSYQGGPAGSSSIHEGTGPSAMYQLASDQVFDCTQSDETTQYANVGQDRLCSGGSFIFDNFGPQGVLEGQMFTVMLTAAAGAAVYLTGASLLGFSVGFLALIPVGLAVLTGWLVYQAFFDPSGSVVDSYGNPINGATATVLRASTTSGPFTAVDPSSGEIEPATNPETTDSTGAFHWDAIAGVYKVRASAPGCHAPGAPTQGSVTSASYVVPPPAIGILLTLACAGSTPHTPTVNSLEADSGPTSGGNQVDIIGTALSTATGVHFGSAAATHLHVLSPYAISVVAPAGHGTVPVTVTTSSGTSKRSASSAYTHVAPITAANGPRIHLISPATGTPAGGTVVTITGSHLAHAISVTFGGAPATAVTNVSATKIRAVTPTTSFPGPVSVTVTTISGQSAPTAAATYLSTSIGGRVDRSSVSMTGPRQVTYQRRATLHARLRDAAIGDGIPGVLLQFLGRTAATKGFVVITSVRTSPSGIATAKVAPRRNTTYKWHYAGQGTTGATTSATRAIQVAPRVTAVASARRVAAGHAFQISGIVKPGAGGQVSIERKISGRWRTLAIGKVRKRRLPSGHIVVGYVVTLVPAKPEYLVLRVLRRTVHGVDGWSPTVDVRVT